MKSATQMSILDIWTSTSLTSWIHHQSHDSKCLQMSLDKQVFPLVGSTTFFDPPLKITRKSHFATLRAKRASLDNSTTWWRMKNCNHVIRSFCRTKKKLVVSWRVIVLPHAIVQGGPSQGTKTNRNLWRIEMILLLFQSSKSKMHLLNEYHNETSAKVLQMWLLKAVKDIRLSSKKKMHQDLLMA